MKYFKQYKDESEAISISCSDAYKQLAEAYGDGAEDLIQTPGAYNLPYCTIYVEE